MKLGSLFDGIGGFPLVGSWLGFEPVWASEIEEKPISITKRQFPSMKHLGDITKINGAEIEPVDLITFGSPCQDLSVAGKRAGLEGSRSNLFLDAVRIIYEMRDATNGEYPKFAVWENVPGAFSSNKGLDFCAVLSEITQTEIPMPKYGKWANAGMVRCQGVSIAWRVLDAQYWGVPQRRKRIFLVADFREEPRPEILFEPEGVSRYFAQSGKAGQRTARSAESCIRAAISVENHGKDGRYKVIENEKVQTLSATMGTGGGNVPLVLSDQGGSSLNVEKDPIAPTSRSESHGNQPCVCYGICSQSSNSMKSDNPHSGIYEAEVAKTLDGNAGNPSCNQGGICVVFNEETVTSPSNAQNPKNNDPCHTLGASGAGRCICIQGNCIDRADTAGCNGKGWTEDVSYTLNTVDRPAVCYENSGFGKYTEGIGTLRASGGDLGGGSENIIFSRQRSDQFTKNDIVSTQSARQYKDATDLVVNFAVRRLTPLECERLQGFPDYWTLHGADGEEISDTQRYKALGNSMALPCVEFVLQKLIETVEVGK